MAIDAYSSCPCGSGKKFKWCCQPVHVQIDRAFRQEAEGQHDAALRTMDEVIAANPGNPEPLGRKAQILYNLERVDDAENTLQQALEINPKYPFGHLLRGLFRQHEGEVTGALLLFRKAAEFYDPEALDMIARVYELICECELKLNRPVAARAAMQIAQRADPNNPDRTEAFETIFGEESRLPKAARREYTFQSPPATAPAGRRGAWDQALQLARSPRLSDLVRAFEQLTGEDAEDAAAWYNLGLARAWLGDNREALEALDNYVIREPDEARAGAAWALGEVLRCGQGMEDEADYLEHSYLYQMRNPQQVVRLLQEWEQGGRLVGMQVREQEGILTGLVLDYGTALTAEHAARQLPHMGAHLLIIGDHLRIANASADALDKVRHDLQQRAGAALSEPRKMREAVPFHEVLSEALVFPVGYKDEQEARQAIAEHAGRFYEDTWVHRPLRSLQGVPPIDAAGHATLRKKLLGVIQFVEDCSTPGGTPYEFDRLRRKLGLIKGTAAGQAPAAPDVGAMSTAELSALSPEALTEEQAEQAYQAALKLDARELAGAFARSLVSRPANPRRPDRYSWYGHLVQTALERGDTDAALNYLNEGEKADSEQNEGRRRNDYELRRGQIHARRGEADLAQDVFERLIARAPSEMRYRSSAAEAMLSARQGARALAFAEQGLARAREKNDRDSEDHFKELVSAARKSTY
jgi:tetratricopeptide (TPR) repeat protein